MPPWWLCPQFLPRVSVKLSEVMKLSEGVMSIQIGGHGIIKRSGLKVPQSNVRLVNVWGRGWWFMTSSASGIADVTSVVRRARRAAIWNQKTHTSFLFVGSWCCWWFFLGSSEVSWCRMEGDLETWPWSGQCVWRSLAWAGGQEGIVVGLGAMPGGASLLTQWPRVSWAALQNRTFWQHEGSSCRLCSESLAQSALSARKVFVEGTRDLEPGYLEAFPS